MDQEAFNAQVNSSKDKIEKLDQLERKKMDEYKRSNTIETKFQVDFVGFLAEKKLIEIDEMKRKDLFLINKSGEIALVGLPNSGKRSLLNTLKKDLLDQYIGTLKSSSEELIMANIKFRKFDLGSGNAQAHRVWKDYFPTVDSIIFLVDATDRYRFAEAKAELHTLLSDEQIADVPILILGTKSDIHEAVTEERLHELLGISSITSEKNIVDHMDINNRRMKLFMCNTIEQQTFGQAFRWLSNHLKNI